jgi:hypothetical protein
MLFALPASTIQGTRPKVSKYGMYDSVYIKESTQRGCCPPIAQRPRVNMPRVTFAAATDAPEHEVGSPVSPTKVEDGDRTAPQSPTPATAIVVTTIVDDAQECLAQSNLMFLYADLRLLSATGRINTKFESLCIDSDRVPKTTSAEMAQLEGTVASTNDSCGGVSPVQIMAILFVELRQEVIAQRRRIKEQLKKDKGWVPKSLTANEDDEDDEIDDDGGLLKTITDNQGRRRLEMDMHANIRAYNDMLAHDLKGMPEVQLENIVQHAIWRHWSERRRSKVPLGRHSRFARSFDAVEQPTNDFDDEESKNSSSSAPGRFHMSSIFGGSSPSVMHGSPGRFHLSAIFGASSPNARRSNHFQLNTIEDSEPQNSADTPVPKSESNSEGESEMIHQSELYGNNGCVEGTRTTNPGHGNGTDPALMRSSMQGRYGALEKQLATFVNKVKEDRALHHQLNDYEAFAGAENVGNKVLTMTSRINRVPGLSSQPGRNMSENELLDFMTKCIESRDSHSLDFMAEFFKDDTVAQVMVKSEAQFVWLQDWFPIKDCIYAISVDMKKKRVVVVFRGAITRADWSHGFDAKTKRCENPVSDSYVGKGEYLRVHRGFYQYLFRMRKDTSTTKYDEIATKGIVHGFYFSSWERTCFHLIQ